MQYSRTEILTALHRKLDRVDDGDGGGVCMLTGTSGMGKTHVVKHFLQQTPSGTARLFGAAIATGTPPLMPICRAMSSDTHELVLQGVESTLYEYSQSVPLLRETLGPFLRVHRKLRQNANISNDVVPKETQTFFVLSEMLRRTSNRVRTILVLDDVQWLDASSLSFLGFLAEELKKMPLLVVLSGRSNGSEPASVTKLREALTHTMSHNFDVFSLPPLSLREVHAVAERFLKTRLECTAHDLEWLLRSSRGVPQYLYEVLATLTFTKALQLLRGTWRFVSKPTDLVLPESFKELAGARLEQTYSIDPNAAPLVQHAAVVGRVFDARFIARLLDVSPETIARVCARIERATGLIERIEKSTHWQFDHDLTREAVLAELGDLAPDAHERVARRLTLEGGMHPLVIARHFEAANMWSLAADYYENATKFDFARFAFAEAADSAQARVRVLQTDSFQTVNDELESVAIVGRCLVAAQKFQEAAAYLAPYASAAKGAYGADLLHSLARAELNLPDMTKRVQAVTSLKNAIHLAKISRSPATALDAYRDLILAHDYLGRYDAAQAAFREAYTLAVECRDKRRIAAFLRLTCMFWQPEKVIEATKQALSIARTEKYRFEEAQCLNNLGTQYWHLGQLDVAEKMFDRARRILQSMGNYRLDIPTNNLGLISIVRGRFEEGSLRFELALSLSMAPVDRILIAMNAAVAQALAGNLPRAIAELQSLSMEAQRAGDTFQIDCVHFNMARAFLASGLPEEAICSLENIPLRHWITDEALILAKRCRLLLEANEKLGRPVPVEWEKNARLLEQTTKPQSWLYKLAWEHCDVQFWQE